MEGEEWGGGRERRNVAVGSRYGETWMNEDLLQSHRIRYAKSGQVGLTARFRRWRMIGQRPGMTSRKFFPSAAGIRSHVPRPIAPAAALPQLK